MDTAVWMGGAGLEPVAPATEIRGRLAALRFAVLSALTYAPAVQTVRGALELKAHLQTSWLLPTIDLERADLLGRYQGGAPDWPLRFTPSSSDRRSRSARQASEPTEKTSACASVQECALSAVESTV